MPETNRDMSMDHDNAMHSSAPHRRGTSARGFASMDKEKQREIARKGGRAAHLKGTAHEFTPEEARIAGRKGGEAVSRDRAHMAEIGREGGQARGHRASQRAQQEGSGASTVNNVHSIHRKPQNPPSEEQYAASVEKDATGQDALGPNIGETDRNYKQSGGAM